MEKGVGTPSQDCLERRGWGEEDLIRLMMARYDLDEQHNADRPSSAYCTRI